MIDDKKEEDIIDIKEDADGSAIVELPESIPSPDVQETKAEEDSESDEISKEDKSEVDKIETKEEEEREKETLKKLKEKIREQEE